MSQGKENVSENLATNFEEIQHLKEQIRSLEQCLRLDAEEKEDYEAALRAILQIGSLTNPYKLLI